MLKLSREFRVWLVICGYVMSTGLLVGQAPLVENRVLIDSPSTELWVEWRKTAASRALDSGLFGLAENLYRERLREPYLEPVERFNVQLDLASALIAQQDFAALRAILEQIPVQYRENRYALYQAISIYGTGRGVDVSAFRDVLQGVQPNQIKASERSWYFFLDGLLADLEGRSEMREAAFKLAEEAAVSSQQRAFFKSLVIRDELIRAPASEALAVEIRRQLEGLKRGSAAFNFVREYAIVLHNLDRGDEAVAVIDRELNNNKADYGRDQRDQLLLLRAMIQGFDTVAGRIALQELIRYGKNREMMSIALQLIGRASDALSLAELSDFLNEIISRPDAHPLLGQMYYMRSELALARGDLALAENDARLLLEQFPGLQQIENVYRLFAYAALQRNPPQHRAAADFLIQLRDRVVSDEERGELNRLVGDCYFLKGDYADAVDFYRSAYLSHSAGGTDSGLLLRLITSELRSGQVEEALLRMDQLDLESGISVIERWQIEWNIAQALKASGEASKALQRIRLLLESDSKGVVPSVLDLRLRWLEARLQMLEGDLAGLLDKVDGLLARIDSFPVGTLDDDDARLLITETLLLKIDLLMLSGDTESGREVLLSLREGYPTSAAAERSYLTEAEFYTRVGNLEAAQQTLGALAERYPEGQLAAQALFENALLGEQRGVDFYAESVRTLDTLAQLYPENSLLFAARLKQGDLLRLMNDFTGAQIVYENLIHAYPDHPQHPIAVLSRADCLLALAKDNEAKLESATLVLERLVDLPGLPVDFQAEAAYKWAFALERRDLSAKAIEVLTYISGRLLLDPENAVRLGNGGRYWVSRAMLDLGRLLEESGETEEARRVYRKMLAYNLPGQNLAQSRADRIRISEE